MKEKKLRRRLKRAFGKWALRPDAVFLDPKGNIIMDRREALKRADRVAVLANAQ